ETPVGFKHLGPVMMREQALAAGEESGGYAFRGHIPERDGILSSLFFLDMMVKTGKRPSELVDYLFSRVGPHYFDRVDIPLSPEQNTKIEKRLISLQPKSLGGKRIISRDNSDGTRFSMECGSWTLIRFSGTEPLLRIYAEADSQKQVARILEESYALVGI
ncbi:phosphoglucomutase/phosphomannomutase family protein, partial [Dehalococcoidia bacterium]|nr:phosphoglucomutase/phosphomannomutase family protein [Dehalococcoidia bacterium]